MVPKKEDNDAPPKILALDIEKSFTQSYHYDQWKINIPHGRIKVPPFLISAAYQWYGEKKLHSVSVLDDPKRFAKNPKDDYLVVKTLGEAIGEADYILAYNGAGFDMKEVLTSTIIHRLPPLRPVTIIDPYQAVKSQLRLEGRGGNSLAAVSKILALPSCKDKVTEEQWIAATEGDLAALKKIVAYNKKDIAPMIELFDVTRPYLRYPINMALFGHEESCPNCGSTNRKKDGHLYTLTAKRAQYRCRDCSRFFRSTKSVKIAKFR